MHFRHLAVDLRLSAEDLSWVGTCCGYSRQVVSVWHWLALILNPIQSISDSERWIYCTSIWLHRASKQSRLVFDRNTFASPFVPFVHISPNRTQCWTQFRSRWDWMSWPKWTRDRYVDSTVNIRHVTHPMSNWLLSSCCIRCSTSEWLSLQHLWYGTALKWWQTANHPL